MKICLYAHDWNYIDSYEPVIKILEEQNVDFEILALKKARYESYGYFSNKYKQKYGNKFITLYDIKYEKAVSSLSKLPVFGLVAEVTLNISILKNFLAGKKYTHIIVSDDRIIEACALIKAANEAHIKNIILYPVEGLQVVNSLMLTKVQAEKSLPRDTTRGALSRVSGLIYPKNTMRYEGKPFYFYPPNETLRLKGFEIFPENPWVRGSNKLTKVAVNSKLQAEENFNHGMKANKVFITGFPPHDKLSSLIKDRERRKEKIKDALRLNPYKKIFLIAGTNYSDDFHPAKFEELNKEISRLVSILLYKTEGDFNFIFKVHPRVNQQKQEGIFPEQVRKRVRFVTDEFSVYELITVSDSIINFVSASTDAALITDAPIFCYKIPERTIFEQEISRYRSITPLHGISDLERTLSVFGKIPAFDEKSREEDRKNFGIFDGRNAERFVQLLLLQ